ncbi:glycosyltransferase family 4 protein [Vibrio sp. MA40-2]|uniref:glycosyltransferase family 4 protein n=1 Tax=Vibrio sp. MA40-2 TaxID=3391828 RepID=UPI0039A5B749
MNKKPVILVNHLLEPGNKISGISNYLFYLLNKLLDSEQFTYVMLTCWDENKLPDMLKGKGLTVVTLPYIESTPKNILSQFSRVRKYARQYKVDLEFNPNPLAGIDGPGMPPLVNVVHDLYFDVSPSSYKFHHRLWWRMFFPSTLKRAKKTICVSNNTQNDLIKYHEKFRHKTTVVKEAACLNGEFVHREREDYGLFVASVSPNKGAEVLIRAMKLLEYRGTPVKIIHTGRDPVGYLTTFANQYGLKEGPFTVGYLSEQQLVEKYSKAKFLAFPSFYEGFGLPVLEAQKYGVPVIATDIAVLREVAGQGAQFFPLGDAEALADSIANVISNPEQFEDLSNKATQNESQFSWTKAAKQTEQVFLNAI